MQLSMNSDEANSKQGQLIKSGGNADFMVSNDNRKHSSWNEKQHATDDAEHWHK